MILLFDLSGWSQGPIIDNLLTIPTSIWTHSYLWSIIAFFQRSAVIMSVKYAKFA